MANNLEKVTIPVDPEDKDQDPLDAPDAKPIGSYFGTAIGRTKNTQEQELEETEVKTGEATMPCARDAEEYNMNHLQRGKAIIFNHKNFNNSKLEPRDGTDKDRDNLAQTLIRLDFEVVIHNDLRNTELMQKIQDLSKEDHSDRDCLLIAVLSHGKSNKIYSYDGKYTPNELFDPFTAELCPSLAGKPKIFLIQACQGRKLDGGTVLRTRTQSIGISQTDSISITPDDTYTIPNRADFLIVFSTVPGYYSWRNPNQGSWFIQAVVKIFNTYGRQKELQSMITTASRDVALNFESYVPKSAKEHQKKQIPYVTSTLIREIYFKSKNPSGECIGKITSNPDITVKQC